jgi:hypothetical protein
MSMLRSKCKADLVVYVISFINIITKLEHEGEIVGSRLLLLICLIFCLIMVQVWLIVVEYIHVCITSTWLSSYLDTYAKHVVYLDFVSKLCNFFITSSPFILFRRYLLYFENFTVSIGELMVANSLECCHETCILFINCNIF